MFYRPRPKIISTMLWKQLKEDEFETDLIEVIREYNSDAEKALHGFHRNDFMEIYLFLIMTDIRIIWDA